MCIKCEMKKMIAAEIGFEVVENVVGKIDPKYVTQLADIDQDYEALKEEVRAEEDRLMSEYAEKIEKQLKAKYNPLRDKLAASQREVFQEALKAAGVDGSIEAGDYSIDRKTGEVKTTAIIPQEAPTAEGVH